MKFKNILHALTASCFLVMVGKVSAQVSINAEIRPRTEFRNGFKTLRSSQDKPAFFTEQRSRLSTFYADPKYKAAIVFQDIRIWGETGQINKSDGLTSVHEAWVDISLNKRIGIKAGRQELVYDDHRILGNLDWAAQARSHDALLLKFTDSTLTLHAGFAYNQDSKIAEPVKLVGNYYSPPASFGSPGGGLPNYKTMQYAWFQKVFGKSNISALIINTGWQLPDTSVNNILTAGVNPTIVLSSKAKVFGSFFFQTGQDRLDKKLSAWLASASVQYQAHTKLSITIGADILSGSDPGSTTSKTFDPLFGTHHAFYGHMDYFYVGSPHAQQGATIGLQDYFIKTNFKSGARSSLLVHLHEFRSQVRVLDPENPGNSLSRRLANEIDLIFNYELEKAINIKVGYSQLVATKSLESIKGGDHQTSQNWAWCMLTVKPTLLATAFSE